MSEPVGVLQSATSGTQDAPAAITGDQAIPGTPAPLPSSGSKADDAFNAFLAAPVATPDNLDTNPPTSAPLPQSPPVTPAPAPQVQVADVPEDEATLEQSLAPTEQQSVVPAKNLSRALKSRRQAMTDRDTAVRERDQSNQIVDQVLHTFTAAGVNEQSVTAFLRDLSRVRQDPQAQAAVLAHLGIKAPTATAGPAFDLTALKQKLEAYDVEGAMSVLGAMAQPPAAHVAPPVPQIQPPAAPQVQTPQPQTPPQRQSDMDPVMVLARTMRSTIDLTYGAQEGSRISKQIDQAAGERITALREYGLAITPQAVAKVYQESYGSVLQAEVQRRASPPPIQPSPSFQSIRPAPVVPPVNKQTADELFAAEFGKR